MFDRGFFQKPMHEWWAVATYNNGVLIPIYDETGKNVIRNYVYSPSKYIKLKMLHYWNQGFTWLTWE